MAVENTGGAAGAGDTKAGTGAAAGSEGTGGTGDTKAGAAGAGGSGGDGKAGSGDAGKAGAADAGKAGDAGKGGTGAGADSGGKAGDAGATPKAPDKYALKVPDDRKPFADADTLQQIEKIARANDWTNDDAQAALEEHLGLIKTQSDSYAAATKADPDYGGDKFEETQRLSKRAIDRIRPEGHARRESFLTFLGRGGAGNHLEVVSFLADLGKLIGEDKPAHGKSGGSDTQGAAQKIYDNPKSRELDEASRR